MIDAVSRGLNRAEARRLLGVPHSTYYTWTRSDPTFDDAISQAEESYYSKLLDRIESAADAGKWQAAAWILERRRPQQWAQVQYRTPEPAEEQQQEDDDSKLVQALEALAEKLSDDELDALQTILDRIEDEP